MLTILPQNDPQIIASYSPETDNATLLVSENGGEKVGHIVVEQKGDRLFIIGFSLENFDLSDTLNPVQYVDTDSLLRAAGSYALNRGIYELCCEKNDYFPVFLRFGFKEINNYLTINLKQLFKVCKN